MPNWCVNDVTIEHDDPAMLEKIVTRTDNDLDDLAVKHLKDLLLPDTRVEK